VFDDWWRIYVGPFNTLRETYNSQNNLRYDDYESILIKGRV
jgi:cell division protein FtsN